MSILQLRRINCQTLAQYQTLLCFTTFRFDLQIKLRFKRSVWIFPTKYHSVFFIYIHIYKLKYNKVEHGDSWCISVELFVTRHLFSLIYCSSGVKPNNFVKLFFSQPHPHVTRRQNFLLTLTVVWLLNVELHRLQSLALFPETRVSPKPAQ